MLLPDKFKIFFMIQEKICMCFKEKKTKMHDCESSLINKMHRWKQQSIKIYTESLGVSMACSSFEIVYVFKPVFIPHSTIV